MSYRTAVITCSDRAAADPNEDRAGRVLRQALSELGLQVGPPHIVPLIPDEVRHAIEASISDGARIIVTTGGTGIAPNDITVDVTSTMITRELPGIMEEVRRVGAAREPRSLLSRSLAGIITLPTYPPCLIINAPGSRGGARDTMAIVGSMLEYIIEQLDGSERC